MARGAKAGEDLGFRYPWPWMAGMAGAFVGVHAVYYALGIRFNDGTLDEVMHFIDPVLLRTRLLESLWYLHIQPPLFNLFVGLVLKLTPESPWLFTAIYLGLGLLLYLCVFLIQLRLGVQRGLATATASLFMASPSFILWEHYLLYTMPCAALLAFAAVLLFHVIETRGPWAMVAFFATLFAVCGMRSMFHFGYLVIVLGVLLVLCRGKRRQVLLIGLVPLVLLFGVYFKNLLVFGELTACTFVEKNLWIMTAGNMRWDDKTALIEAGSLSKLSRTNRWASLDAYPPEFEFKEVPEAFRDVPVLSTTHKTNGAVNYNHYGNIEVCNIYGADAKYVLRHHPRVFLIATSLSWYRYFKSSSAMPMSVYNLDEIPWLLALYDYGVYGKLPIDPKRGPRLIKMAGNPPYLFLLIGLPLVFFYGLYRAWRPGFAQLSMPQRAAILFMAFNILLVAVLGCTFDFLETARYRFMTDGLSVALLGFLLQHAWTRAKSWGRVRG